MTVAVKSNDTNASASYGGGKVGARLIGSTCAGVMELVVFHPVDTIAKRLMYNKEAVSAAGGYSRIIFRDAYDKPILHRYGSLFPGVGFAAVYKISQRIYKFGGQPVVVDFITRIFSENFKTWCSDRNAKTAMHAVAGSLIVCCVIPSFAHRLSWPHPDGFLFVGCRIFGIIMPSSSGLLAVVCVPSFLVAS